MANDLNRLTEEALRLPPKDRVFLAESLLLTVESSEPAVDEVTLAMLERRVRDLLEGKAAGIQAEQALREARESIGRAE